MPNDATSLSALDAASVAMLVTANNIANVNTNGYKAESVVFQTGPRDQGVRVAGIFRDMSAGPAVVDHLTEKEYRAAQDLASQETRDRLVAYDNAMFQAGSDAQKAELEAVQQAQDLRAVDGEAHRQYLLELSNVDLAREFVTMSTIEAMYSANAAAVRAQDELTGNILNLIV